MVRLVSSSIDSYTIHRRKKSGRAIRTNDHHYLNHVYFITLIASMIIVVIALKLTAAHPWIAVTRSQFITFDLFASEPRAHGWCTRPLVVLRTRAACSTAALGAPRLPLTPKSVHCSQEKTMSFSRSSKRYADSPISSEQQPDSKCEWPVTHALTRTDTQGRAAGRV